MLQININSIDSDYKLNGSKAIYADNDTDLICNVIAELEQITGYKISFELKDL